MSKASNGTLFFYQGDKLITVKQGDQQRAIFRSNELPLAEQQLQGDSTTSLLATDDKGSVFMALDAEEEEEGEARSYSAYGHDPGALSIRISIGFKGEFYDKSSHGYLLGNGYRRYSTVSMRFFSTDRLSPFGAGGLNTYCFVRGDPVNFSDPSGHMPFSTKITKLTEPDIFTNIIKHLDLDSAVALSETNRHLNRMTRPALQEIKRFLNNPEKLIGAALGNEKNIAKTHAIELLVRKSDIDISQFPSTDAPTVELLENIRIARSFRASQNRRTASADSTPYGSDSEDEIQRINEGIRKALKGHQL
ncbi:MULTISPECIES: RHS repeat-associated core domain-containing protein [Pseudomonas]|uniref:RHS repeat-associated core domain-containing protein n=1 Tax=Pseudomonas TaxID=286 RepID=UPI001597082D|nr:MULTISPECIES: RHS repeat-associated core domain-containing protein [Pseudomonas]